MVAGRRYLGQVGELAAVVALRKLSTAVLEVALSGGTCPPPCTTSHSTRTPLAANASLVLLAWA